MIFSVPHRRKCIIIMRSPRSQWALPIALRHGVEIIVCLPSGLKMREEVSFEGCDSEE